VDSDDLCADTVTFMKILLTLSLPNKFSAAKFLICFNIQYTSMSLKVGENVFWVSNSLDLGEAPSYLEYHPDPSCLHMALWLWLTGEGLKKINLNGSQSDQDLHCKRATAHLKYGW